MYGFAISVSKVNFWLGAGVFLSSLLLIFKKIPMNRWFGLRFTKAYKAPPYWYKINRYGGFWLMLWSIPLMSTSLIVYYPNLHTDFFMLLISFSPMILAIPTLQTYLYSLDLA